MDVTSKKQGFSDRHPGVAMSLFVTGALAIPILGGLFLACGGLVLLYLGAKSRGRARLRARQLQPTSMAAVGVGEVVRVRGAVVGSDTVRPLASDAGPGVLVRSVVVRQISNIGHEAVLWSADERSDFAIVEGDHAVILGSLDDMELEAHVTSETTFRDPPASIAERMGAAAKVFADNPVDELSYVFREHVLRRGDRVEVDGQALSETAGEAAGFRQAHTGRRLVVKPVRVSIRFGEELEADANDHRSTRAAVVGVLLGMASFALWWWALGLSL